MLAVSYQSRTNILQTRPVRSFPLNFTQNHTAFNMQNSSLNPTFGIEIECMYVYNTKKAKPADGKQPSMFPEDESEEEHELTPEEILANDPRIRGIQAVHAALSAPFSMRCSSCQEVHDWKLPLSPLGSIHQDYKFWTVKQDQSVRLTPWENQSFIDLQPDHIDVYSIEIVSRILSLHGVTATVHRPNSQHLHEITSKDEVEAVCDRLYKKFNQPPGPVASDNRLVINSQCSTHVHVGNGDNGFDLQTVKNVLSTVVACERVFDSMHSTTRIGGSTLVFQPHQGTSSSLYEQLLEPASYNRPWSAHFTQEAYARVTKPNDQCYPGSHFEDDPSLQDAASRYDIHSWLKIIENAPEIKDLLVLQSAFGHSSDVNLRNLDQTKKTIEFRQHAGTLRASEILAWVEVCVHLIEFANAHSEADVATLCKGEWYSPLHTANDFLRTLNVSELTRIHYTKVVTSESENYGDLLLSQELEEAGPALDVPTFGRLVDHLIRERSRSLKPVEVAGRIHEKLTQGCYGRFTADYLNLLDTDEYLAHSLHAPLSAEQRRQLTIETDDEPSADDEPPSKRARTS